MLRKCNWQYLLLLVAGIPAFTFAYLGHFSRLVIDDYCLFDPDRTADIWKGIIFYYETQSASWSRVGLHSIVSPFEVLATALTPLAIILFSTIGLYWLLSQAVASKLPSRQKRVANLIISVLISAAAINAFVSPQSLYWYNSSIGYTLPAALFTIYLALLIALARRERSALAHYLGLAASFTIAFVLGGASEMYDVFQFAFLALAIFFIGLLGGRSLRRRGLSLLLAGILGTAAALIIHLSSPGMHARVADIEDGPISRISALPELLSGTLSMSLNYLARPEAFAGFMLLFGLGLVATLLMYRPAVSATRPKLLVLAPRPIWLCLCAQLLFVPILWTHTSDLPQVAGRYSFAFATVLAANLASLIVIAGLLLWRRRVENSMRAKQNGLPVYVTAILLFVTLLLAMTQARSIHIRAVSYLFFTALIYLGALGWQLAPLAADRRAAKFARFATLAYFMPIATVAALVAVSLYGRGSVTERILSPIAYLQVIPGLIWGAYFAFLIQHSRLHTDASGRWIRVSAAIGMLLVASVATGIVFGHAKQIPDFAVFAREWDARHQQLIEARDSGTQDVEVQKLTFDLSYFLVGKNIADGVEKGCAELYYGIDNIRLARS